MKIRYTSFSRLDVASILDFSRRHFGQQQSEQSASLMSEGVASIRADPFRPSCRRCPQYGERIQAFHLSLARKRIGSASHVIYFRVAGELGSQELQILRILHERMEPLSEIEMALRSFR